MIQETETFLHFLDDRKEILKKRAYDEAIIILKQNGANQTTCTKVIMSFFDVPLSDANEIVSNSKHWEDSKERNDRLNNDFFDCL